MNKREQCCIWGGNGFLKGAKGVYRLVVMALTAEQAATALGITLEEFGRRFTVSRTTKEWALFDEHTSIGDIFASLFGASTYMPVDAEDIYHS